MTSRSIILPVLCLLTAAGCEPARKSPDVVQTGHSATAVARPATADSTHPPASEPRKVLDWETWIPQWQVALRHPDTIPVEMMSPLRGCAGGSIEPPAVDDHVGSRSTIRIQVTRASFDAIAAAHGFVRQKTEWVTVGADTTRVAAIPDSVSGWRILRGGWYGRPARPRPDSNTERHSRMIAARQHPAGCTIVLTYMPNGEGGDDTAAVRRIIESVMVGGDVPAGFAPLTDEPDTAIVTPPDPSPLIPEVDDPGFGIIGLVDTASVPDTVRIHSSPEASSRVVARFFHSPDSGYKLAARDSVEPSFSEYAYETEGLAALDANHDTSWVRVRYGTRGDTTLTGWTRPIDGHVFLRSWVDLVFDREAAVGSANPVVYLASPDGRVLSRRMVDGGAMYPRAIQGPWMMVRVVIPSQQCEMQAEHSRETYAWVRFLTDRGRPYLAYAPRGC